MGVTGASVATDAGFVVLVAGLLFVCRAEIGLPVRPLLVTGVRSLIAATAVWLLLVLLGGGHMSPLATVTGIVLTLPVFGGALMISREIRPRDLATLRRNGRQLVTRAVRAR